MPEWNAETAQWYADHYGEYATNELAVLALSLPTNGTIIDIGCGTGCALRHAAKQVTSGHLIGVDPVPRMVEIAKAQSTNTPIRFLVGKAEQVPLKSAIADFVFAFDSFDYWSSPNEGLQEVARLLKSAGKLVVVKDAGVPGTFSLAEFLEKSSLKRVQVQQIQKAGVEFTLTVCSPE